MATIEELLNSSLSEEFAKCTVSSPEGQECEPITCTPNDLATVPDWTAINVEEPYLNEKICEYEVAIEQYDNGSIETSAIQAISQSEIDSIEAELRTYGLTVIADYYLKSASEGDEGFEDLFSATYVKDYKVDLARGKASLKGDDLMAAFPTRVLIAIPAFNLDQAPDVAEESTSSDSSAFEGVNSLEISAFDLQFKLIRLKNALRVYSKYQAIANNDPDVGTKIYYKDTKRIVYISEFKDYIDDFFPALQDLVKEQGDYVMKPNRVFKGTKNLTEMNILFDDDTVIDEIYFYSYGCEDKIKATAGFSKFMTNSYAQNRVISGFISKINEIDDAITAREPMVWYDFVKNFFNIDVEIIEGELEDEESTLSCFLQTLEEDTHLFDQMLNQIVSIPDIIGKKFNKYLCMTEESLNERKKLELNTLLKGALADSNARISAEFSFEDPLIEKLGELIKKARNDDEFGVRDILDELTVCGLVALLLSIMECLGAQLSFEQMLKTAVKSALKNMKMAQIGKMFGLFPAATQAEIYDIVIRKLTEEDYSVVDFSWPWEEVEQERTQTRNTLATQTSEIITAIIPVLIEAIIETVGAEDLLEYLNTLPGAEIIAKVLSMSDCVEPPIGIKFPQFMKVGDIEFCRANYAITLPLLPEITFGTPLQLIVKALLAAARDALLEAFRNLIITLLAKLVYQLKSELCSLLETLGESAIAALGNNSEGTFASVLNNSACGEQDDATESIGDMFSELGSDQSDEESADLINLLSTVLTATELCDLLKGRANEETVRIAFNIIKYNKTNFLNTIPDERSTRSFFASLGNYVSTEELDKLCATVEAQAPDNFYAGASVCVDSGIYNEISGLRSQLLQRAGLNSEDVQSQMDKINARTAENLEQIMDILQGQGVEDIFAKSFPSLVSEGDPTCPTTTGIFAKDDPVSYITANEDIEGTLDGIDKKFERDMVGRKGFFDYALCAADGTRLRRQNFINNNPLLSPAATIRLDRMDFETEIEDNNFFTKTIGTPLKDSLSGLASSISFNSSLGAVSVSFSYEGEDAHTTAIEYTHSNQSDPDEDEYNLSVTETYDENSPTNEDNSVEIPA